MSREMKLQVYNLSFANSPPNQHLVMMNDYIITLYLKGEESFLPMLERNSLQGTYSIKVQSMKEYHSCNKSGRK